MRYLIGTYSSAVRACRNEVAQREKLLQFAVGGSEDLTGSRWGRQTFQWLAHPYTACARRSSPSGKPIRRRRRSTS
jgi:branched-chain amino acid transport system substrate-binding protein